MHGPHVTRLRFLDRSPYKLSGAVSQKEELCMYIDDTARTCLWQDPRIGRCVQIFTSLSSPERCSSVRIVSRVPYVLQACVERKYKYCVLLVRIVLYVHTVCLTYRRHHYHQHRAGPPRPTCTYVLLWGACANYYVHIVEHMYRLHKPERASIGVMCVCAVKAQSKRA